jgi:hypothetical protein
MNMQIEDTIFETGLPVNTRAMLARMEALLKENNTNCMTDAQTDPRVRRLMWLLNSQVLGTMGTMDMADEWGRLRNEFDASLTASEEPGR